jgi:hypothetical protein
LTAIVPSDAEFEITETQGLASHGEITLKSGRVFEDGAVIADMEFTPDDSGLEPQVQMNGNISFRIAFGKTGVPDAIRGRPLSETFTDLGNAVVEVIENVHKAVRAYITAHGGTPYPEKG